MQQAVLVSIASPRENVAKCLQFQILNGLRSAKPISCTYGPLPLTMFCISDHHLLMETWISSIATDALYEKSLLSIRLQMCHYNLCRQECISFIYDIATMF